MPTVNTGILIRADRNTNIIDIDLDSHVHNFLHFTVYEAPQLATQDILIALLKYTAEF